MGSGGGSPREIEPCSAGSAVPANISRGKPPAKQGQAANLSPLAVQCALPTRLRKKPDAATPPTPGPGGLKFCEAGQRSSRRVGSPSGEPQKKPAASRSKSAGFPVVLVFVLVLCLSSTAFQTGRNVRGCAFSPAFIMVLSTSTKPGEGVRSRSNQIFQSSVRPACR
jgi:hypothetical protein